MKYVDVDAMENYCDQLGLHPIDTDVQYSDNDHTVHEEGI